MQSSVQTVSSTKTTPWVNRMIIALAVLYLSAEALIKLLKLELIVEEIRQIDNAESLLLGISILCLLVVSFM